MLCKSDNCSKLKWVLNNTEILPKHISNFKSLDPYLKYTVQHVNKYKHFVELYKFCSEKPDIFTHISVYAAKVENYQVLKFLHMESSRDNSLPFSEIMEISIIKQSKRILKWAMKFSSSVTEHLAKLAMKYGSTDIVRTLFGKFRKKLNDSSIVSLFETALSMNNISAMIGLNLVKVDTIESIIRKYVTMNYDKTHLLLQYCVKQNIDISLSRCNIDKFILTLFVLSDPNLDKCTEIVNTIGTKIRNVHLNNVLFLTIQNTDVFSLYWKLLLKNSSYDEICDMVSSCSVLKLIIRNNPNCFNILESIDNFCEIQWDVNNHELMFLSIQYCNVQSIKFIYNKSSTTINNLDILKILHEMSDISLDKLFCNVNPEVFRTENGVLKLTNKFLHSTMVQSDTVDKCSVCFNDCSSCLLCEHFICEECLGIWLNSNKSTKTCPVCRKKIDY